MSSAADFLLSPAVQAILKVVLASPAQRYAATELAQLARLDLADIAQTLPPMVQSGMLLETPSQEADTAMFGANTAFLFYPELRRIALKSFAAAEPLRAMLQSKFRATVLHAFLLGEDPASGTLHLLLVYGDVAPERAQLDLALKKLLKSGAIRQHVQTDVLPEKRFHVLRRAATLRTRLAAPDCIDISPASARKAKPAPAPVGLLERARRGLTALGR